MSLFGVLCEARRRVTERPEAVLPYDSNSLVGTCDCRIIDLNVPSLISLWFGTGMVIVEVLVFFCMMIWLANILKTMFGKDLADLLT